MTPTQIADQVVPEYRGGKRGYSCSSHTAKRWGAAYDAAAAVIGAMERDNAGLRDDVAQAEREADRLRTLAKANNDLVRLRNPEITRLRTAGFRAWQAIWDAMNSKGDLGQAALHAEGILADALAPKPPSDAEREALRVAMSDMLAAPPLDLPKPR